MLGQEVPQGTVQDSSHWSRWSGMRDPGQLGSIRFQGYSRYRHGHDRHKQPQPPVSLPVSHLNCSQSIIPQYATSPKDVGNSKAIVAAEFIMNRVPGVKVTPYVLYLSMAVCVIQRQRRYFGKIQDKDEDYYMQFNLIICGLDSVEARRWINATLVNMVDPENPESLKPLIDGGTEGDNLCVC